MFVDASAIVAILARETGADSLSARLAQRRNGFTSPIAICEATTGLARSTGMTLPQAVSVVENFLADTEIEVTPITPAIGRAAIEAFDRYGKGRHRAALNLGDCFAYACTRALNTELLCTGDDFGHTDVVLA